MTCYQSRGDWHSYVKNSSDEAELQKMTIHLTHCPECRDIVSGIRETAAILAKSRTILTPPVEIRSNVMMSIDKNRYKKVASSHLFELKNWGLSMMTAGLLLFALNLTSLNPNSNFEVSRVAELNSELGKQMALPFDRLSQMTYAALGKIESLTVSQTK